MRRKGVVFFVVFCVCFFFVRSFVFLFFVFRGTGLTTSFPSPPQPVRQIKSKSSQFGQGSVFFFSCFCLLFFCSCFYFFSLFFLLLFSFLFAGFFFRPFCLFFFRSFVFQKAPCRSTATVFSVYLVPYHIYCTAVYQVTYCSVRVAARSDNTFCVPFRYVTLRCVFLFSEAVVMVHAAGIFCGAACAVCWAKSRVRGFCLGLLTAEKRKRETESGSERY